jgi:TusA-related sulfurtransferase
MAWDAHGKSCPWPGLHMAPQPMTRADKGLDCKWPGLTLARAFRGLSCPWPALPID